MGRAAPAGEIRHQRALLSHGEFVTGGLADNDELRFPLQFVRFLGAVTASLFSDHEEKTEIVDGLAAKTVTRFDHRGNNALRVARPAAIEKVLVFPDRQNRWNG